MATFGLADQLICYWTLDEASGTRADSVGGMTLTDNNTVTQNPSVSNQMVKAAQFTSANSESLSHIDDAKLSLGDVSHTWCAWVYLDDITADHDIVSKYTTAGGVVEYIFKEINGGSWGYYVQENGGTVKSVTISSVAKVSTWYFVVAWYDNTVDTLYLQVDNGQIYTTTGVLGPNDAGGVFAIGTLGSGVVDFMNGRIDGVGFWKRVLSTSERAQLYNNGVGMQYPFLYEQFNNYEHFKAADNGTGCLSVTEKIR